MLITDLGAAPIILNASTRARAKTHLVRMKVGETRWVAVNFRAAMQRDPPMPGSADALAIGGVPEWRHVHSAHAVVVEVEDIIEPDYVVAVARIRAVHAGVDTLECVASIYRPPALPEDNAQTLIERVEIEVTP